MIIRSKEKEPKASVRDTPRSTDCAQDAVRKPSTFSPDNAPAVDSLLPK
jgi:hypothetical protein